MVEWLSWLLYKSGFICSNIFETTKDRPNTPTSLKLSQQRVHELVGKLDCLTQHPKKPLNQNDTSRWGKTNENATRRNFARDFVSFISVSPVLTSYMNFKHLLYEKVTTHFSIPKTPKLSCLAPYF